MKEINHLGEISKGVIKNDGEFRVLNSICRLKRFRKGIRSKSLNRLSIDSKRICQMKFNIISVRGIVLRHNFANYASL